MINGSSIPRQQEVHIYWGGRSLHGAAMADAAGLADQSQIIPVPERGTAAFSGHLVSGSKANAAALVTNPFYHAWRAGALASGGEIIF